jgi:hypothetical protein
MYDFRSGFVPMPNSGLTPDFGLRVENITNEPIQPDKTLSGTGDILTPCNEQGGVPCPPPSSGSGSGSGSGSNSSVGSNLKTSGESYTKNLIYAGVAIAVVVMAVVLYNAFKKKK